MLDWLRRFGEALGHEVSAKVVVDWLATVIKEEGKTVVRHKIKAHEELEAGRGELLAFFHGLTPFGVTDPVAQANLLRRHDERRNWRTSGKGFEPGDEDAFVERLFTLYKEFGGRPVIRRELFERLGRMDDDQFDLALEFVHNDWVRQQLHRYGRKALKPILRVIPEMGRAGGWGIHQLIHETDENEGLRNALGRFRKALNERGIRS